MFVYIGIDPRERINRGVEEKMNIVIIIIKMKQFSTDYNTIAVSVNIYFLPLCVCLRPVLCGLYVTYYFFYYYYDNATVKNKREYGKKKYLFITLAAWQILVLSKSVVVLL